MGVSLSTARYLAPASFLYNFALQQYGLNTSPGMKDISDRNLSFFSPNPYFIGAFFFPQQLFQFAWMYKLWKLNPNDPKEKKELDEVAKFVPYYALGNVCIGTWLLFWNSEQLKASNIFCIINTSAQLYYVFTQLAPMNTNSWGSILTHINVKTFAGIGVLDVLHNTSVAYYKDQVPGTMTKVATALGFAALGASSDWILGGCLAYDLVGIATGQFQIGNKDWAQLLSVYAVGTAAIVAAKNLLKPPYTKKEYSEVDQEDQV